jgi:hypothetical protein
MAGQKFLILNNGKRELKAGSQSSAGAANAGDIVALNNEGLIDSSMLQDIDVTSIVSSENLSSGDYVNIFDDGGTVKVRKADNTNERPAMGYVKDNVTAPAAVNVFFEGANTNLSGLTEGARIYLGTAGGVIETPLDPTNPSDDGKIHQLLGIAISETEVNTDIQDCIKL